LVLPLLLKTNENQDFEMALISADNKDLRHQNSQLHTQLQETTMEHCEALRSQKLQAETLNQCCRQQLEELEEKLWQETSFLKKQLQDTEERQHGTHQHTSSVSEVVGHIVQVDDSSMMLRTPSTE
jgi:hypothetical protein